MVDESGASLEQNPSEEVGSLDHRSYTVSLNGPRRDFDRVRSSKSTVVLNSDKDPAMDVHLPAKNGMTPLRHAKFLDLYDSNTMKSWRYVQRLVPSSERT